MRFLLFFLLAVIVSPVANAQEEATIDTLAPYQKNNSIPSFSIQTPDSSWFIRGQLQPAQPTLIIYFSPDCGHCQMETEEILAKMKQLKDLQVVLITSKPVDEMKNFAEYYKLSRYPSIKVGTDHAKFITRFYKVKFTPFSAVYDKEGKLYKVYEKGIDMDELIRFINKEK